MCPPIRSLGDPGRNESGIIELAWTGAGEKEPQLRVAQTDIARQRYAIQTLLFPTRGRVVFFDRTLIVSHGGADKSV